MARAGNGDVRPKQHDNSTICQLNTMLVNIDGLVIALDLLGSEFGMFNESRTATAYRALLGVLRDMVSQSTKLAQQALGTPSGGER